MRSPAVTPGVSMSTRSRGPRMRILLRGANRWRGYRHDPHRSGEVLTNNHVIEGATSIRVTIPARATRMRRPWSCRSDARRCLDPARRCVRSHAGHARASSELSVGDGSSRSATPSDGWSTVGQHGTVARSAKHHADGGVGGRERLHGVIQMDATISRVNQEARSSTHRTVVDDPAGNDLGSSISHTASRSAWTRHRRSWTRSDRPASRRSSWDERVPGVQVSD